MNYLLTELDKDTLPDAMLDMTRKHLRIDFDDDDDSIKLYLQWAIGYVQHFTGLQIFGATTTFKPDGGGAKVQVPVQPVNQTFVASDADAVTVTADYAMSTSGLASPVYLSRVDGAAIPTGMTFVLDAGFGDPADLDPALHGNIVQMAATLYEHRESITTLSVDEVPYFLTGMIAGLWVPRC